MGCTYSSEQFQKDCTAMKSTPLHSERYINAWENIKVHSDHAKCLEFILKGEIRVVLKLITVGSPFVCKCVVEDVFYRRFPTGEGIFAKIANLEFRPSNFSSKSLLRFLNNLCRNNLGTSLTILSQKDKKSIYVV